MLTMVENSSGAKRGGGATTHISERLGGDDVKASAMTDPLSTSNSTEGKREEI